MSHPCVRQLAPGFRSFGACGGGGRLPTDLPVRNRHSLRKRSCGHGGRAGQSILPGPRFEAPGGSPPIKTRAPAALLAASLILSARAASAVTVDGRLEPDYGPALSTQTTQTNNGDSPFAQVTTAAGSELDQAYGFISGGVLYLFLSGNLMYEPGAELLGHWLPTDIFIDSTPGGQNRLRSDNPTIEFSYDLNQMAGLTFDAGFEADYWLSCGTTYFFPLLRAYYATLPAGGGAAGYYLGYAPAGGQGTLSGGTNPDGIEATVDDSNRGGVTAGCAAAAGAGVTTGIEWAIPLSAIGNPAGCIKVSAFVSGQVHSTIANQVLGPVPPGTCNLGASSTVNFASIAGDQFFTVCPPATPARTTSWGVLKSIYR